MPRTHKCVDCTRDSKIQGRGLCRPCYYQHSKRDTLDDYPRMKRPHEHTLEDVLHLRGLDPEVVARRMGMQPGTIAQALKRSGRAELAGPFWASRSRTTQHNQKVDG
jgi:hypothetical protein